MRSALTRWTQTLTLATLGLGAPFAVRADAPMPATSALALSDADGTIHTRAGVQVALSGTVGSTDRTLAFKPVVHARMAALRQCYVTALAQNSRVSGRVSYTLLVTAPGRLTAKLVRDEVRDAVATSCVERALSGANPGNMPRGARVQVAITFDNPVVRLGVVDPTQRLAEVRVLGSGLAETSAATQANEVRVDVQASAYARTELAKLGTRVSADLAGLLDCRRKSSRRFRPAQGTLSLTGLIADGGMRDVRVVGNTVGDRKSPVCVSAWLARMDVHDLEKLGVNVAVTFSK